MSATKTSFGCDIDRIYNEDCLVGMQRIDDASIDMILCDLPYGTTACKWDTVIPFEPLWEHYRRVIKENGAIVLFSKQPFTTKLINSNMEDFRYCLIWKKDNHDNPLMAKKRFLNITEDICIFYQKQSTYNPQGLIEVNRETKQGRGKSLSQQNERGSAYVQKYSGYPKNILEFGRDKPQVHPTQKPVALFEYLIKTYTNPGETVLDNCLGSGTTAIAAINTGRHYIGFEKDTGYFDIAQKRIAEV